MNADTLLKNAFEIADQVKTDQIMSAAAARLDRITRKDLSSEKESFEYDDTNQSGIFSDNFHLTSQPENHELDKLSINQRIQTRWDVFSYNYSLEVVEDVYSEDRYDISRVFGDSEKMGTLPLRNFTQLRFDAFSCLAVAYYNKKNTGNSDKIPCNHTDCPYNDARICVKDRNFPVECERLEEIYRNGLVSELTIPFRADGIPEPESVPCAEVETDKAAPLAGALVFADYWVMPLSVFLQERWELPEGSKSARYKRDAFRRVKKLFKSSDRKNDTDTNSEQNLVYKTVYDASSNEKVNYLQRYVELYIARQCHTSTVSDLKYLEDNDTDTREVTDAEIEKAIEFGRLTLEAVALLCRHWFNIGIEEGNGGTGKPRGDYVFSVINDGRALLMSNMRTDGAEPDRKFHDKQTRTLILDLGLNREERGRVLHRCMDIAAFRHLSLRGLPYVDAATDTLSDIGMNLSMIDIQSSGSDSGKQIEDKTRNQLEALTRLSRALDLLNLFFTYGISGKANSTKRYLHQIESNVKLLREHRLPGYQTLDGFLSRYRARAQQIEMFRIRYEALRHRVAAGSDLLRARFEQLQMDAQRSALDEQTLLMTKAKSIGMLAMVAAAASAIAAISSVALPFVTTLSTEQEKKDSAEKKGNVADQTSSTSGLTQSKSGQQDIEASEIDTGSKPEIRGVPEITNTANPK